MSNFISGLYKVVSGIKNKKDSNSKFDKLLNSKYNKTAIIIVEIALLLTVVVLICLVFKGDISLKAPETTRYIINNTTENGVVYKEPPTFATSKKNKENESEKENETVGNNVVLPNLNNSVNNNGGNSNQGNVQTLADPSGWSRKQILSKAAEAVNKTKAYSGNLTVTHKETFDANVTECTGGTVVASVVNLMVGWVVSPVDETLNYQNGKAVNSEGETVPIILPKKGNFTLTENGAKSATINRSGNEYIIKINIVEESVGMHDVPTHNAASIGYLDVGGFDLSFMEVDSADIIYKGSSLELHINADGYVTYAKYNIPMNITGSAHSGSISGSAVFDGEQTEVWELYW